MATLERLNGSLRRECTGHIMVLNERRLKRVLGGYIDDSNRARTHFGIEKESPMGGHTQKQTSKSAR